MAFLFYFFNSYTGFDHFAEVFNKLQIACDKNNMDEVLTLFPEAMKILSFLHERLLKFLGKEVVNTFKLDPSFFLHTDEIAQSQPTGNFLVEDNKQIFNKEQFVKNFDSDETMSKFKMFDMIDSLYKPDAMVQTVKGLFEKKKMNEIQKQMEKFLEKIKFFSFFFLIKFF